MAPRLLVEVRWGKLAGTKVAVAAGATLRVGRTERADLVIEHDGKMTGAHFELAWDGETATVRDLGSIEGTSLGGRPVTGPEKVPHGGWIKAGETHLLVYAEGRTPPEEEEIEGAEEVREERRRVAAAERALEELREVAGREPLYAVLDTAREERILELLREHVEPHRSLYEGAEGETLEDVAPYLVGPMRGDSALLDKLVQEGWGKRWGIWCTSGARFAEVRRHWRRFLMVELEDSGEKVYFRFYDPGVLRVFWEASTESETEQLMGECTACFLEQAGGELEQLTASAGGE